MSNAAQEHLQTVKHLQASNEELSAAVQHFTSTLEIAVAALAALDTAAAAAAAAAEAAQNTYDAATAAFQAGEAHQAATVASGHGTLTRVVTATEACQSASLNAAGVLNGLQALTPALTEAKEKAVAPFVAAVAEAETLTGGVASVHGLAEDAETQIQQTIDT